VIQRTNTKKGVTELKVNSAISCYKESSKCVKNTHQTKKEEER
jgi:hypothetical protein